MSAMKTIIYVNGAEKLPDRRKCAGVKAHAAEAGWNVQPVHALRSRAELAEVVSLWRPAGFVVNCGAGQNGMPISNFGRIPTVFFDHPGGAARPAGNCVFNDAAATAKLAARELLALDLPQHAYVGWTKRTEWSTRRLETFSATLELHGFRPAVFDAAARGTSETERINALARWLSSFREPVGVFAANDHVSSLVAAACTLAGLSVPGDVAIVGVDNDEYVCDGSRPTLTSVALDYFAAGRLAAETLDRLMARGTAPSEPTLYPPLGIVRRESTRRFPKSDKLVADAVERIRREACNGLSARDVLKSLPCSRRSAEMRFRAAVGHSILHEIRRVRLETAQDLMRSGAESLDLVANRCGYKSASAFSIFFRAETGMTPTAWRAANLGKGKPRR